MSCPRYVTLFISRYAGSNPQTPNPTPPSTPPASRARSRPCASVSFLTYSLFLFTRAHVPSDGPSTNPPVPCYAFASRLHAPRHAACPSPLPSRCLGPCLLSYAMHPTPPLTHLLSIYSRRRDHDLPLSSPSLFPSHMLSCSCVLPSYVSGSPVITTTTCIAFPFARVYTQVLLLLHT